ncbi:MAG: propionyl-CoA synthetase [Gammaproteobacteria bacterium]|jgi:propionyl-CoA synthetase
MTYLEQHQFSINDPEAFWKEQAKDIDWFTSPKKILSKDENDVSRWFADGVLNTAYLALDYHVENGRADQAALIYDSPITSTVKIYTYRQLRDEVAIAAGAMLRLGIKMGDRVLIYMPMVPEAAITMLACARIGAIHSVVFGGFAAKEVATRIDDATPDMLITASCGIETDRVVEYKPIVDKALAMARHKVEHCVVLQRPQHRCTLNDSDLDWQDFIADALPADCIPVKATDPLYILYTSGTTGQPKGVVRDNGGHAVALKYSMKAIYNVEPGDVFWAASDVGWVVGHSYIVYAPLLAGCTTILYEGKPIGTPDAGAFWRVIEQHNVKVIFTAPTAFRAIRKTDPNAEHFAKYDVSGLQSIFLAGERTDPPTYHWLAGLLQKPIIDHWWQTETGWSIVANMTGIEQLPVKAGSSSVPVVGFDVKIVGPEGNLKNAGEVGEIVIKQPLPPGCFPTIWNDAKRYQQTYMSIYPGYYLTGDGGYIDGDGYVFVMGRTDDVINVAGHRFSTGEMEELIASHSSVAECAVIGINDSLKGQIPLALIVLKDGIADDGTIGTEIVQMARRDIGAVACLRTVITAARLPKTRSGKILRKTMRSIADGETYTVPSTIDDPVILDEIQQLFDDQLVSQ